MALHALQNRREVDHAGEAPVMLHHHDEFRLDKPQSLAHSKTKSEVLIQLDHLDVFERWMSLAAVVPKSSDEPQVFFVALLRDKPPAEIAFIFEAHACKHQSQASE